MARTVKIEASIACANFKNLERDVRQLEEAGIDYVHFDMMDGTFVPNLCLDFTILKAVKDLTTIPIECHLMIDQPERYLARLASFGPEYISIHVEATRNLQSALQQIRDLGVKPGVALNPATPLSTLEYVLDDIELITVMTVSPGFAGQKLIPGAIRKLADIRALVDRTGHSHIELQVDGNVSFANIPSMIRAGATMLVGGTSSVFHEQYSIADAVAAVRVLMETNTVTA